MAPDYRGDAAIAAEEDDDEALEKIAEWWVDTATSWRDGVVGGAETQKRRTIYRKKAYEWGLATTHMLHTLTGAGWEQTFQPEDPAKRGHPSTWPYVAAPADQGTDGMCFLNYLARKCFANVEKIADPSHGAHNDVLGSIYKVGLKTHAWLFVACLNAAYGPWVDAR